MIDKTMILKALIAELEEDLRRQLEANGQAAAGATDGEARAETKWDTCGLESSYLARGHAQLFQALAADVHNLRGFVAPDYANRSIGVGALVTVELGGDAMHFFLLHCGGGTDLVVEACEVTVITPESPVGSVLLDKRTGDSFSFRAGSSGKILDVA
ncbi:MAG: GreA/GreB family elongation factor [Kiritimatiellales bacterium]|nr:GreA/GreB family elongation factor [Kiritimatiellales bacterium]